MEGHLYLIKEYGKLLDIIYTMTELLTFSVLKKISPMD